MEYMQAIFTTLWTILNHRNKVVHEGKEPNPMEVVLTAQSQSCKYKEAFPNQFGLNSRCRRLSTESNIVVGHWQLIMKIAGVRRRKAKRSAQAYEAKDLQGVIKFYGVASSKAISTNGAIQEALMEAITKAKKYGFQLILFLTKNKNLVQIINKKKKPGWQEKTMVADLEILYQNGLFCNLLVIPNVFLDSVCTTANLATRMPIHQSWDDPAILYP